MCATLRRESVAIVAEPQGAVSAFVCGEIPSRFLPANSLYDLFRFHGNDYGNPYLTVSPWQPLWTLVLPAVWIAVLFSHRIKKFCDGRIEQQAA